MNFSVAGNESNLMGYATALVSDLADRFVGKSISLFARQHAESLGLPYFLVESVLIVEDKRFPTHHGIDILAVLRALFFSVLPQAKVLQGASTLSQQLFTMRLIGVNQTRPKRTLSFKLKQTTWAVRYELQLEKWQILSEYLEQVYAGRNYYGIRMASLGYFGIPASKINAAQAIFLAERIGSPNAIRHGRLVNIFTRRAIRDYFKRCGVDNDLTLQIYKSVYGEIDTLTEVKRTLCVNMDKGVKDAAPAYTAPL